MDWMPNNYRKTLVFTTILLLAGSVASAAYTDVFAPFRQGEAALNRSQRQALDNLRSTESHELLAIVRINNGAVGRSSVNFNLTADKQFRASRLTVETSDQPGRLTWKGKLDGDAGSVLLIKRNQNVTGTITAQGVVYQVRPLGSGLHAIVRLNPAGFPPDEPPGKQ